MSRPIRVTIWNEHRHERNPSHKASQVYPEGMHAPLAQYLGAQAGIGEVRVAVLDEPDHGLTEEALAQTDVLTWWGHAAHGEVRDEIVERVHRRVLDGMGLLVLHSGHFSKIFKKLMGTTCNLKWREADEKERFWVIEHGHPIVEGLGEMFELPAEEMYGEPFDVPAPDTLVLVSWFPGGEVFRSGCCYHRGRGKVFYFRPGHETYPTYYDPNVLRVISNAVRWCAPVEASVPVFGNAKPLEAI
jgi:trehalose utilization protein